MTDANTYIKNYVRQYEQLRDNIKLEIERRLPEIMESDPLKGQEIKESLERKVF